MDLLENNVSAVFALAGTVIGVGLTFLTTWLLKRRDLQLRLLEKVLERRVDAHEQVIMVTKLLRSMQGLGYTEAPGRVARTPCFLVSRETYLESANHLSTVMASSSTWLAVEVTRELYLLQDYIVNLDMLLTENEVDTIYYPVIGSILRNDFIDFSSRLEKLAFTYFQGDLLRLKMNNLDDWHKYPLEETTRRLEETDLWKKREQIQKQIDEWTSNVV